MSADGEDGGALNVKLPGTGGASAPSSLKISLKLSSAASPDDGAPVTATSDTQGKDTDTTTSSGDMASGTIDTVEQSAVDATESESAMGSIPNGQPVDEEKPQKRRAALVDSDDSSSDEDEVTAKQEADSDDEDAKDEATLAKQKEEAKNKKIQDLFGASDSESDEDAGGFAGFELDEIEPTPEPAKKKGKSKTKADGSAKPKKKRRISRDDDVDAAPAGPLSEYEQMMEERKQKKSRKRRKQDSESAGNAAMEAAVRRIIDTMEKAHEEDEQFVKKKRPATRKLKALKTVEAALKNITYQEELIDKDIFTPIAKWLSPNPDTMSLPNVSIRTSLIKILAESFINVTIDDIRPSGIGKVLMMLKESKAETRSNKILLEKIITAWSRQIWKVVDDQAEISVDDRQEHYQRVASLATRRRNSSSGLSDDSVAEVRKPGMEGFIMRARVPMELPRDYSARPRSKINMEDAEARVDQNRVQFKSMAAVFKDKLSRSSRVKQHARGINISGSVTGKGQ